MRSITGSSGRSGKGSRAGGAVEPGSVAWIAALGHREEPVLEPAGDRPGRAEQVVVDLVDRADLGGRAGDEELVGGVELGPRDVALGDLDALVGRKLDDGGAGDALEDGG